MIHDNTIDKSDSKPKYHHITDPNSVKIPDLGNKAPLGGRMSNRLAEKVGATDPIKAPKELPDLKKRASSESRPDLFRPQEDPIAEP